MDYSHGYFEIPYPGLYYKSSDQGPDKGCIMIIDLNPDQKIHFLPREVRGNEILIEVNHLTLMQFINKIFELMNMIERKSSWTKNEMIVFLKIHLTSYEEKYSDTDNVYEIACGMRAELISKNLPELYIKTFYSDAPLNHKIWLYILNGGEPNKDFLIELNNNLPKMLLPSSKSSKLIQTEDLLCLWSIRSHIEDTMKNEILSQLLTSFDHGHMFFVRGRICLKGCWSNIQNGIDKNGRPINISDSQLTMPPSHIVKSGFSHHYLISSRDQLWALLILDFNLLNEKMINDERGVLLMWLNIKNCSGRYEGGLLMGIGYTNVKTNTISVENTFIACIVLRKIIDFYEKNYPHFNISIINSDFLELESGLEIFLKAPEKRPIRTLKLCETYLGYEDHPIEGLNTTSWYVFYQKSINPFELS